MISLSKRAKLSKEFFSKPPDPADIFYAGNTSVNSEADSFSIKSLSTFKQLLTKEEDNVYRFLVDTMGVAWFARETRPHNKAPKHFQMTGDPLHIASCMTAGNLKFRDKTGAVLKNINHRSGDFYPSLFSLRWLLAIFIINEELLPFKLPKFLVIKETYNDKMRKHVWRLKKIKKWVNSFRHDEELINRLRQQSADSKAVYYEAIVFNRPEGDAVITPPPLSQKHLILRKLLNKSSLMAKAANR